MDNQRDKNLPNAENELFSEATGLSEDYDVHQSEFNSANLNDSIDNIEEIDELLNNYIQAENQFNVDTILEPLYDTDILSNVSDSLNNLSIKNSKDKNDFADEVLNLGSIGFEHVIEPENLPPMNIITDNNLNMPDAELNIPDDQLILLELPDDELNVPYELDSTDDELYTPDDLFIQDELNTSDQIIPDNEVNLLEDDINRANELNIPANLIIPDELNIPYEKLNIPGMDAEETEDLMVQLNLFPGDILMMSSFEEGEETEQHDTNNAHIEVTEQSNVTEQNEVDPSEIILPDANDTEFDFLLEPVPTDDQPNIDWDNINALPNVEVEIQNDIDMSLLSDDNCLIDNLLRLHNAQTRPQENPSPITFPRFENFAEPPIEYVRKVKKFGKTDCGLQYLHGLYLTSVVKAGWERRYTRRLTMRNRRTVIVDIYVEYYGRWHFSLKATPLVLSLEEYQDWLEKDDKRNVDKKDKPIKPQCPISTNKHTTKKIKEPEVYREKHMFKKKTSNPQRVLQFPNADYINELKRSLNMSSKNNQTFEYQIKRKPEEKTLKENIDNTTGKKENDPETKRKNIPNILKRRRLN